MSQPETRIETDRLNLRSWREADIDDFARLHSDPDAMRDYRCTFSVSDSRSKLNTYIRAFQEHGYSRWKVATKSGDFLGYVGLYPNGKDHPLGLHSDIGWRLLPHSWGNGYATEAAHAALKHAFQNTNLTEVLAYTHTDNISSQTVIARLPFHRDASRDYSVDDQHCGLWHGLVWFTRRSDLNSASG